MNVFGLATPLEIRAMDLPRAAKYIRSVRESSRIACKFCFEGEEPVALHLRVWHNAPTRFPINPAASDLKGRL